LGAELELRKALHPPFRQLQFTIDDVTQMYRLLRTNYEEHKRYSEAGDFFIGEMDMLRLRPVYNSEFLNSLRLRITRVQEAKGQTKEVEPSRPVESSNQGIGEGAKRVVTDIWVCFLSWLYRIVCWVRTNVISIVAWYDYLGRYGESIIKPAIVSAIAILMFGYVYESQNPGNGILRSIGLFFQIYGVVSAVELFERLAGALLLALLFIALRRNLERH